MCFRLLAINKFFKSFPPIVKPLRDISFLPIIFVCQFPFMLYAKHTKNWALFFGIVKPGKALEPRTVFVLTKSFEWKRIIRTRLTLHWNAFVVFVCGFFLIYVYYSWSLNTGLSSLRRRRCFYSRQRRWFLGRQRSRRGPLEIIVISLGISSLHCVLINFQKKLNWFSQRQENHNISENTLFRFNQGPIQPIESNSMMFLSTLKSSQVFVVNLSYIAILLERI